MTFTGLYTKAQKLNRLLDTEYAENNEKEWNHFDDMIKRAYANKEIDARQFNDLALTAFYDYFDLIEEVEE